MRLSPVPELKPRSPILPQHLMLSGPAMFGLAALKRHGERWETRLTEGDLLGNLGNLIPKHRREVLVGQHVDIFVDEVHRAVGEKKIPAADVIAAEIGDRMRATLNAR